MERHFTVPVTVAAAVHVGLFFGFTPGKRPLLPPAEPPLEERRCFFPMTDSPPPPEITGAMQAMASATPSAPVLPDAPRPAKASDFLTPVQLENDSRPDPTLIATIAGKPGPLGDTGVFVPGVAVGPPSSDLLDDKPRARLQVSPFYPAAARAEGRTGEVVVDFEVDEGGTVVGPKVVSSTDPVFDAAALQAVAKWRFEPGRLHGRIVRFRMSVPLVFRLSDD